MAGESADHQDKPDLKSSGPGGIVSKWAPIRQKGH
jgi:hypothetical protein